MSAVLPTTSPLPEQAGALLDQLSTQLDAPALWWASGYLAGMAQRHAPAAGLAVVHATTAAASRATTIVYGSQTGNGKRIAEALAQRLHDAGVSARLLRADAYRLHELEGERQLLIVISTQGDGDPPDDARDFVEHLLGKRAPKLPNLKFAVLGLGDSSYPKFCEIARRLDERLTELGASRWLPRADADVDIDAIAQPWIDAAIAHAATPDAAATPRPATMSAPLATVTPLRPTATSSREHARERPFNAEVLVNQRITGRGSSKDVRHLELALGDSGLSYEPGDALGVWPTNSPESVAAILATLHLDGDESIDHDGHTQPLRQWLAQRRELTRLSRPFLIAQAQRSGDRRLQRLLGDAGRDDLARTLAQWQVTDLLRAHPASWDAQALVAALRPLTPRLYSLASSMKEVGAEAHLTVAHVNYQHDGQQRHGAASHLLATSDAGARIPVFIERNERFRLPRNGDRDIVMIGAGTGVAPFRGFVQERAALGARGRHWLLFGNPHARSDFLYQLEWQRALKEGRLHRLDLAFSRDGVHGGAKTYVQHRLREHGRELLAWLDGGAHLYVCGALAMAMDVHAALVDVLIAHAGHDAESAEHHLRDLQRQQRYSKDMY